jgi:hypothetical protein
MPAAYLIVESNISDPEQYKAYMAAAPAAWQGLSAASTWCVAAARRCSKATGTPPR